MFGGILFMAIEKPYELKQRRVAQKHRNHAVEAMVELIMATYSTAQNTSGLTSGPNSQTGFTSVSSSVIDSVNNTTASLQEARGDVNGSEFWELENEDGSVSGVRSPKNDTGTRLEDSATRTNHSDSDFIRRKVSRLPFKDNIPPSLADFLSKEFGVVGDASKDEDADDGRVGNDTSAGELRTVSRLERSHLGSSSLWRSNSDRHTESEGAAGSPQAIPSNRSSQDPAVPAPTTRNLGRTSSTSAVQTSALSPKSHQTQRRGNTNREAKEAKEAKESTKQRKKERKQQKEERQRQRQDKQQQRLHKHAERQRGKLKQKHRQEEKEEEETSGEAGQFKRELLEVVKRLESRTWRLVAVRSWDGMVKQTDEVQWSFAGAMLYSVTVVTTIGE